MVFWIRYLGFLNIIGSCALEKALFYRSYPQSIIIIIIIIIIIFIQEAPLTEVFFREVL
jgi:hypothetical protein